jgi:hypothetical protein
VDFRSREAGGPIGTAFFCDVAMTESIIPWESGLQPEELRLIRTSDGSIGEMTFVKNKSRRLYRFVNPSSLPLLVQMFNGIDFLSVFDRNREDNFHRDFGRYRIEFFQDDPFSFDADRVEVGDLD